MFFVKLSHVYDSNQYAHTKPDAGDLYSLVRGDLAPIQGLQGCLELAFTCENIFLCAPHAGVELLLFFIFYGCLLLVGRAPSRFPAHIKHAHKYNTHTMKGVMNEFFKDDFLGDSFDNQVLAQYAEEVSLSLYLSVSISLSLPVFLPISLLV